MSKAQVKVTAITNIASIPVDTDWLDDSERRKTKVLPKSSADLYLASHCLLRSLLAAELAIPPEKIQMCERPGGRPELADTLSTTGWRFNLSHTRGAVGVALASHGMAVGVDIESIDRKPKTIDLADRFFSQAEALEIARDSKKDRLFLRYWTLREAFVKALGTGLAFPLSSISFSWNDKDNSVCFRAPPEISASSWTFKTMEVGGFFISVAVENSGRDFDFIFDLS